MIEKMLTHLHLVVIFGCVGTFAKEKLLWWCSRGFGEVSEAKGPSDATPDVGSGVTGRVRWLTLGAAQLGGYTGVSDGVASDAG
jgi:hypothetical protein